jgi:lipoprotein-anchoring transpeptidase ErfK/SrfK
MFRTRSMLVVAATLVLLLGGAAAVLAYDSSQSDMVPKGIKVDGIDIGGLTASHARARLRSDLRPRLAQGVLVQYHAHRFDLSSREASVAIDINGAVDHAVAKGRNQNLFSRVFRGLTGGRINTNIAPQVTYSHAAVDRLVDHAATTLDHPAQDATISYAAASLNEVPGKTGLTIDRTRLRSDIERALSDASAPRKLGIHASDIQPKVTTKQLTSRYPTIITIDRSGYTLRLWRHLQIAKRYTIAVGRQGLETPAGLYHVEDKEVDPSWHVPNSSWAGALAGQTIPPGPQDPIKARWIGVAGGAGIHGTEDVGSLGTSASHGCIRMSIPDVIELYSLTPYGTPIYIV